MALGSYLKRTTITTSQGDVWCPVTLRSPDYVYTIGKVRFLTRFNLSLSSKYEKQVNILGMTNGTYKSIVYCPTDGNGYGVGIPGDDSDSGVFRCVGMNPYSSSNNIEIVTKGSGVNHIQYPQGVYIDSADRLYITDWNTSKVLVTDLNGTYITHISGAFGSGSTELKNPRCITMSDEYIYIGDCTNKRIAIWKITNYDPFTVETTNYVIDMSSYGDGNPRGIFSFVNQLYITTDTQLVIFRLKDNQVEVDAELLNLDVTSLPGSGSSFRNGQVQNLAVDEHSIYLRLYNGGDAIFYLLENVVNPYFDEEINDTNFDTAFGSTGLAETVPYTATVSILGMLLSYGGTLEGEITNQHNILEEEIPYTFESRIEPSDMEADITYAVYASSLGVSEEIPIELFVGINNAAMVIEPWEFEGIAREVQDSTVEMAIDGEDFTLTACGPINLTCHLELDDLWTIVASQAGEETLTGALVLDDFNLLTLCGAQGRITWFELSSSGLAYFSGGVVGDIDMLDLTLVSSGKASNLVSGMISLDEYSISSVLIPHYRANMSLSFDIEVSGSASNYRTVGSVDILDLTIASTLVTPGVGTMALVFDDLIVDALMPNPITSIVLASSKAVAYNYRRNAVTEYETFPYMEIASDGENFFVTDGTHIYLLNENVSNSLEGKFKIGNIDIDLPRVRNYIDLILSGDVEDGTVTVVTEKGTNVYPISTVRVPGEKRAVFGRGLIGRLKSIEFKSSSYFELDRIRLIVRETKRLR